MKDLGRLLLMSGAIVSMLVSCKSNDPITPKPDDTPIDYGTVSFQDITVYQNYDGVRIIPIYSNPEACKNEVFEYEIEDDSVISIEGDCVYRVDNGTNIKVTAKSEHLEGTFYVSSKAYFENGEFGSKIKQRTIDRTGANPGTSLFLGDSFFEFWKNKTGISESFATAFEGYDVTNIGISATQTKHWRSWVSGVVNDYEAENIVINIGINDVDDASLIGMQAGKNVVSLIEQIHFDNPDAQIYRFTLTRCSGVFANKWSEYQHCNNYVTKYSANKDYINVLDVASLYGDQFSSLEQDGLHPNQDGYNLFKQLIQENVNLKQK